MNQTTKDEVISVIVECIKPSFEKIGFNLKRKRFFECEVSQGNVQQYEINLSQNKGWFSLNLRLNVINKKLMNKVNTVLKNTLLDEAYPYPGIWDKKFIMDSIKLRVSNYYVTGETDWKIFKKDEETLHEFRDRFSIGICSFNNIEEIDNWESQLLQSVEYAREWFSTIAIDDEWIINNTEYPALYLLKEKSRADELVKKYEEILRHARTKEEVELFYKHLMRS